MERPFVDKVENFITDFIHSANGYLVTECIDYKPDFVNADYFFKEKNIIIELKCLEKDLFSDEDLERNEWLIDKWLKDKTISKADIIAIFLRKKQIPEECLQEILKLTRRTFQKIIEKGHNQLNETKNKIGNSSSQRILMICNDGNYLFNHEFLFSLICNILSTRKELDVDCVVYFTVNQVSFIPDSELDWSLWVPAYGNNASKDLHLFVNDLGRQFNTFYNQTFGITKSDHKEYPDFEGGVKTIGEMNFIPKDIIYKK